MKRLLVISGVAVMLAGIGSYMPWLGFEHFPASVAAAQTPPSMPSEILPVKELKGHKNAVLSLAFSPDGTLLASGGADKTVRIWALDSGKQLKMLEAHTDTVTNVAFSPDGKHLLSGGWDRSVLVWEAETGDLEQKYNGSSLGCAAFLDKKRILVANNSQIQVYGLDSDTPSATIKTPAIITRISVSPDGTKIVTGHEDARVRVWDVSTWKMLAQAYHRTEDDDPDTAPPDERLLQSHISIAGFADMHRIVMASNIGASVWEWETKKKPEVFMDSICENAAMKGLLFAANSDDVVVYDLSTGRKEPPQTGWHNAADANALAISDKWVACAIGGTRPNAGVWRAQNDKLGIELYSMSQVRESLLKQLAIEKQAETMAQAAGQAGSRRGPMTRPGTGPTSMRGKN